MPAVSILIPAYNCEDTIERSLESVFNQTYQDFEVIVVDNNCTDSTIDKTLSLSSKYNVSTHIVKCEQKGIVPALNTGLRACQGEWIARQDGDDYWYPTKLEKQMKFLSENSEVSILGTQIRLLDENGKPEIMGTFGKEVNYPTHHDQIATMLLYGQNSICHPSVVIKKTVFNVLGGYEQLFPLAEDLHLWCKCIPHFRFANIDERLVDYTQKKSEEYDARVPLFLSDIYFSMYKQMGIVKGEKQKRIYDWQTVPGGHKHRGVKNV